MNQQQPHPGMPQQAGGTQRPSFPHDQARMDASVEIPKAQTQKPKKEKKARKENKEGPSDRSNMRRTGVVGGLLALLFIGAMLAFLGGDVSTSTYVLRANQPIPAQQITTQGMFDAVEVPEDQVETGAITATSAEEMLKVITGISPVTDADGVLDDSFQIVGQRTTARIFADQQVRPEMFARLIEPASNLPLAATERAMSLAVPAERAAGGILREGDLVDVLVVGTDATTLVAQSVEIIGIQTNPSALQSAAQRQTSEANRSTAAGDLLPSDPIPGIYVLRVESSLMGQFADAQENGDLHLLYRAPDAEDVDPSDIVAGETEAVAAILEQLAADEQLALEEAAAAQNAVEVAVAPETDSEQAADATQASASTEQVEDQ